MYSYIKGLVTEINSNYIVVDNSGIGYTVFTGNPYQFEENKENQIYLYQYVREDEISLYGFKSLEEKELFLKLISVKGLGCKMALPMLATGSIDGIIDAIERENILYLKKFPKIGDKVARQIILDLKGKLASNQTASKIDNSFDELIEVLKGLGYKPVDIKRILPSIKATDDIEMQVKEALRLMLKWVKCTLNMQKELVVKTMDLIRTAYNYEENGYKVLVIKPIIDTKGSDCIQTRIGLTRKVDLLLASSDIVLDKIENIENIKCIFVDEAQFLTTKQIDELYYITKKYDIPVICYGLRVNFKMESFEGSKRLLEIAEELEELITLCRCGEVARYVGRRVNGEYVNEGNEVVIDGVEESVEYVPMCGKCYLKDVKKIL